MILLILAILFSVFGIFLIEIDGAVYDKMRLKFYSRDDFFSKSVDALEWFIVHHYILCGVIEALTTVAVIISILSGVLLIGDYTSLESKKEQKIIEYEGIKKEAEFAHRVLIGEVDNQHSTFYVEGKVEEHIKDWNEKIEDYRRGSQSIWISVYFPKEVIEDVKCIKINDEPGEPYTEY